MTDDEFLDEAVALAREALRNRPPTNGAIADMLPPELRRKFMVRGLRESMAANPNRVIGPSLFADPDDPGMEDPTTVTLPRWHVEAIRTLAELNHRGDLNGAFEWLIETYAGYEDLRAAGHNLRPFGSP